MKNVSLFPAQDNRLDFLVDAIESMFACMDSYIDALFEPGAPDLPYYYNERATLSMLAGGVWRSHPDNLVLEEYGQEKQRGGAAYRGRRDIWFCIQGNNCCGEAKQVWVDATRVAECLDVVVTTLQGEADAVCPSPSSAPVHRLGIVFVVPHIKEAHASEGPALMDRYRAVFRNALQDFSEGSGRSIVWGHCLRDDLLQEAGYYESSDAGFLTRPGLDVILCDSQD